jgi:uncharacterized membrane protein YdjX (TVP38/TMEM64 family)
MRSLVLAALLVALLAAFWLALPDALARDRLRELVAGAGPWGPLLFVVLFSLLEALGVPGLVFIGLAIAVWEPWRAFLLIWAGSVGAGCVGFAFARTIGRGFVVAHLPERFRRFDARLATSGLRYVIAVRIFFYLATPAHWLLGLSGVPFGTALLGSAIGFVPGAALWAFGGGAVFEWVGRQPAAVWAALAAFAALAVAARAAWRRRRASPAESPTPRRFDDPTAPVYQPPDNRPGAHTG